MIQAVNSEIAKQGRKMGKAKSTGYLQWRTQLMGMQRTDKIEDRPQSQLVEMGPNETITPHYHQVDQFQVLVAGSGIMGRNPVTLIALHYADHHTAYGPIKSGPFGLTFFTIRAKSDPGSIRLDNPRYKELLKPTKKRYLLIENIALSTEPVLRHRSDVGQENVLEQEDCSDGLGACMLRLGGNTAITGPDPRMTAGQYYVVLNGSLQFNAASYPVWSALYAGPTDAPLEVCAGPDGLEVLVMNFPRADA